MTIATAFQARATWDDIDGASWQLTSWSQWVKASPGRNLSLAVGLLPRTGASLNGCAAGQYDMFWRNLANNLALYGLTSAYLRLGWEMDGSWNSWAATPGSGKEADFGGCFRRVVQVMRETQPANQWKFVLNTAMDWQSVRYLEAIWPGDAYVDIVAIDEYDQSWAPNTYPYPSDCDAACRLTRQQNAWNSHLPRLLAMRDFAVARGKQMAFPEWGVMIRSDGHGGGDNPYFIQKMHDFIMDPANRVAFHAYFDVSAASEGIDWRLSDGSVHDSPSGPTRLPNSAQLFRQLFGSL